MRKPDRRSPEEREQAIRDEHRQRQIQHNSEVLTRGEILEALDTLLLIADDDERPILLLLQKVFA